MPHIHSPLPPIPPRKCPSCGRDIGALEPFCNRCGEDVSFRIKTEARFEECIYCSSKREVTREHIFGKWLARKFAPSNGGYEHVVTRPERFAFVANMPRHTKAFRRQAHYYHWTVRNACQDCNTGWLSDIHKDAQPLILSMISGEWPEFTDDVRKKLSRWCAMIAINLECNAGQLRTERYQLNALKFGGVPEGFQLSIAPMPDRNNQGRFCFLEITPELAIGPVGHTWLNTTFFCIENIAFHIFSAQGSGRLQLALMYCSGVENLEVSLCRLWPSNGVPISSSHVTIRQLFDIQELFGKV